jgi:hypothetical protein
MKFPIKVTMPPALVKGLGTGKTYIVAGCMIPVPDDTTREDMHKYVTYSRPKPASNIWKIKSDSGSTYTVTKRDNGNYTCNCVGFKFHRKCKHITRIMNEE